MVFKHSLFADRKLQVWVLRSLRESKIVTPMGAFANVRCSNTLIQDVIISAAADNRRWTVNINVIKWHKIRDVNCLALWPLECGYNLCASRRCMSLLYNLSMGWSKSVFFAKPRRFVQDKVYIFRRQTRIRQHNAKKVWQIAERLVTHHRCTCFHHQSLYSRCHLVNKTYVWCMLPCRLHDRT